MVLLATTPILQHELSLSVIGKSLAAEWVKFACANTVYDDKY